MDSHVLVQISRLTKCLVTHVTFVWFLTTVNSAVHNKVTWLSKSLAANSRGLHWNNFSPEWLRLCTAIDVDWIQNSCHILSICIYHHEYSYAYTDHWDEKTFSHCLQVYTTVVCTSVCLVNLCLVVNRLSHTEHKYGLGLSSLTSASVLISILTSNVLSPV